MREIDLKTVETAIRNLCIAANRVLPEDLSKLLKKSAESESDPLAVSVLNDLVLNLEAADELCVPICQDTGMAVVFAEIGKDIHFLGEDFEEAINRGVSKGYSEGYLRASVVKDPLNRVNTGDNTPAIIHTKLIKGDKLKLTVAPKGFGSENKSRLIMLNPSAGKEEIKQFVVDTVIAAGSSACPPMVIGIGLGGDFEYCAYLAKKALCCPVSQSNDSDFYAEFEREILEAVNKLNIGPQGFGGSTTAFSVAIEQAPTHIAGLPLAVNIGCHVTRHASIVI